MLLKNVTKVVFFLFLVSYVHASHFACVLFRQFTAFSIQSKAFVKASNYPTRWSLGWDQHPGVVKTFNTKFQANRIETDGNFNWFDVYHETGFWGRHTDLGKRTQSQARTYLYKCVDSNGIGYCDGNKQEEYLKECIATI